MCWGASAPHTSVACNHTLHGRPISEWSGMSHAIPCAHHAMRASHSVAGCMGARLRAQAGTVLTVSAVSASHHAQSGPHAAQMHPGSGYRSHSARKLIVDGGRRISRALSVLCVGMARTRHYNSAHAGRAAHLRHPEGVLPALARMARAHDGIWCTRVLG